MSEDHPPKRSRRKAAGNDVGDRRPAPHQIELLEDEADVAACNPERRAIEPMHRMPGGDDLAGVRIGQACDAPQQRCLAGAAGSQQGDELSRLGGEGETFEDATLSELLVQVADMDAVPCRHARRRRTDALTWSMIVTITRMMMRMAKTLGKSSRSMLLLSS